MRGVSYRKTRLGEVSPGETPKDVGSHFARARTGSRPKTPIAPPRDRPDWKFLGSLFGVSLSSVVFRKITNAVFLVALHVS